MFKKPKKCDRCGKKRAMNDVCSLCIKEIIENDRKRKERRSEPNNNQD